MKKNMAVIKGSTFDAVIYNKDNSFIMKNLNGREYILENEPVYNFNVLNTPKNDLLLFYKNKAGAAYISRVFSEGKGESRRLMPCSAFSSSFDCVFTQTNALNACFFYTLSSKEKNTKALYATDFSDDKGILIDTIIPMDGCDFYLVQGETPALIYKNKQKSLVLCVFGGKTLREQKTYILSQKSETISDISCLEEKGRFHICYISSQMGSSSIIYRQLSAEGLSSPRILATKKNLLSCLIFMSKNILFIFGTSKTSAFYTFSKDTGATFYPAAVYFKQLNVTSKAQYTFLQGETFKATEIFMDELSPLLISDFSDSKPETPPEFTSEDIIRLKAKIANFEKEINERNTQVTEMSKAVSDVQQQNSILMQQWKTRFETLEKDYNNLKEKFGEAQKSNEELKIQIRDFQSKKEEKEKSLSRLHQENTALKKAKSLLEEEIYRLNNNIEENM